ncbi:MAG: OsmC family protein [Ignavibacteriota bacterium]|nr:OsmC family protein [Ignavibacteriota bacterium]
MPTSTLKYLGDLRTELTHLQSGIVVITDAPTDNNGKGEAFSPTDLMSSSLCACMITIMGVAAQTHGFSIDGATAEITKIMSANPRKVSEVKVEITFPKNNYSDKDKRIIEYIAGTCPVALSLHPDLKQNVKLIF